VIGSRSRNALVRGMLIAAVAAVAPLASACEAGFDAPTLHWHPPTDGATGAVGSIDIENAFVLGAPPNQLLPAGGSAGLFLALANNGAADTLIAVSADAATSVRLPGGAVHLAAYQAALFTGPRPALVLENLKHALHGGSAVNLTLTFQNAGSKTILVPVLPRAEYYSTFSPPAAASPSASATASPSGTGPAGSASPRAAKSPRPSGSPSP
jgi:copper(I)-binding protein